MTPLNVIYMRTPLHHASSKRNNEAICEFLLSQGADVNALSMWDYTTLHYAAISSDAKTAKVLITNKANINAKTENGFTPLHLASTSGNLEVLKVLIESGANLTLQDSEGKTPREVASDPEVVKFFTSL